MRGRGALAPADVLRQVQRIELRTRRLVDSRFAGDYRSVFKGQGMEFVEVREYQPGDEVRTIDWNVSARMGRPFVKRFVEERELTVLLAVDLSGSAHFGTVHRFKREMAAEIAAVLALTAARNNDRVGLVLFSDRIEYALPPRKGRKHALRAVRELLQHQPAGRRTSFHALTERIMRQLSHRAVVLLLSDFVAEDVEPSVARLAHRHDVIAITIDDPAERDLPDIGMARFEDPETGDVVEIDTTAPDVRAAFHRAVARETATRRAIFDRLGIDEIVVDTARGYLEPLLAFFRARARRPRGAVRTTHRGAPAVPR